jgi:ribonuclease R
VHITELGGEYYRFDEVRQELRGERTGIRYTVGTRIRVQVSRVDLDGRKIDFRLVRERDSDARPRAKRELAGKPADELAALRHADRKLKVTAKLHAAAKPAKPKGGVNLLASKRRTARR